MKHFTELFARLDQTTRTSVKVKALCDFFQLADDQDKLWTIALFSGRRPKRSVTTTRLREWAAEAAGLPLWLIEDSYSVVGDLAETISLILPTAEKTGDHSLTFWIKIVQTLGEKPEDLRKADVVAAWCQLGTLERLLFNKLITGGFRVGVSQKLMTRALGQATGRDPADLAHRLMGNWTPDTISFADLVLNENDGADVSRPYPFCLAHAVDPETTPLGDPENWRAEWKWDGIRGQLIVRERQHFVWSRGEELMTDRFPELSQTLDFLPDGTVLDGEILAWSGDQPLPFNTLQKRLGRKTVPRSLLLSAPVVFAAYDLLEWGGEDQRDKPFAERRTTLEDLLTDAATGHALRLPEQIPFKTWDELAKRRSLAREKRAEGVMLKRYDSPYVAGRKRGNWWKWKLDPLTIDAVMIYAQAGHGRRANLFTDFTFAVRDGNDLVPFTKAYSGLTDAEFRQITVWVRKNTLQRFGPVRQVTPHHVFEIAFEGIHESPRHKSGIALRFPRMSRWRHDKQVQDANTLDDLKEILGAYG